jgi:hypothetical protein
VEEAPIGKASEVYGRGSNLAVQRHAHSTQFLFPKSADICSFPHNQENITDTDREQDFRFLGQTCPFVVAFPEPRSGLVGAPVKSTLRRSFRPRSYLWSVRLPVILCGGNAGDVEAGAGSARCTDVRGEEQQRLGEPRSIPCYRCFAASAVNSFHSKSHTRRTDRRLGNTILQQWKEISEIRATTLLQSSVMPLIVRALDL